MGKYTPLIEYLNSTQQSQLELHFSFIESILNSPLPASARQYSAWWANSRANDSHSWAHQWLQAGWEKTDLSLTDEKVCFTRFEQFHIDDPKAAEGYERDRVILSKSRNRARAEKRRALDNNQCQCCGFTMEMDGKYVIEVHHLSPLSISKETVTSINDLVCLCPTCHRISHLKKPPFEIEEVKKLIKTPY